MTKLFRSLALVFLLIATPAMAVQIDFSVVLNDADGKPMKDGDGKVMTLGRAAMFALMSQYPDDSAQTVDEKMRRGSLALRAYEAKAPVDLSVEDVALIKRFIGKLYSPLVVVRALPLLDPKK